ncbi:hypothetical protein WICPIJ_001789 [Wickerhamomyces pijperi]|uniref:Beta-lactamase-related domain-containing protein n=1 Tax=Wickerhamomyces pijperi TaxID=599730 RepID=A0A9P8QAZ1_WICPI|nr:hypothetical protein WICPIJ_001789 [Wickerhamomyces pijperi]
MPSRLSPLAIQTIQEILNKYTANFSKDVPGVCVSIHNTNGEDLLTCSSGKTGANGEEDMTNDHQFWMASLTKLITSVAVLQLVETGKLSLDDGEQLENLIPELKGLPILSRDATTGKMVLVPRKNLITVRQLLAHTAGFGYTFFSPELREYLKTNKISGLKLLEELNFISPLLFEPGTDFNYGAGSDIAGLALERATGMKLGDYVERNIFQPLQMENSTFDKDTSKKLKNLVKLNQRDPDNGTLREVPHVYSLNRSGKPDHFHSGGAGCFGTATDYAKFLSTLANDGVSPRTKHRILSSESIKYLFSNQLEHNPNFLRKPMIGIPGLTPNLQEFFPQAGSPPQGWGSSFVIALEDVMDTGRPKNTYHWYGLANMFYWIDIERGIVAVICAQVLPFFDPTCWELWKGVERAVYKGLIPSVKAKL